MASRACFLSNPSKLLSRQLHRSSRPFLQPRKPSPSPLPPLLILRSSLSTASADVSAPVEPPDYLSEGERKVFSLITQTLSPTMLEVQDISGGCGSMYGIEIVSEKFRGLSVIKQHRLVNAALGEEIKKWHGVQLKTREP